MQRKKLIGLGISAIIVVAGILGYSFIHSGTDAVETMAETNMTVEADNFPAETAEKEETTEEEPLMEEIATTDDTVLNNTDAEQETDFAQEIEEKQESPEPDITEDAQTENLEEIDLYMYTTADLKMRTGGSTESDVIEVIPYGTQIHLTARTADNWYRTERSEIGYVSGKYLSEEEPAKITIQQPQETGNANAQAVGTQNWWEGKSQTEIQEELLKWADENGYDDNPNRWKDLPSSEYHGNQGKGILVAE